MIDFQRIEPPKLVEHFLQICPDFKAIWDEHLAYWGDNERGEYNDIAKFAHFLVDCYGYQKTAQFPQYLRRSSGYSKKATPK